MNPQITIDQLSATGISATEAVNLAGKINPILTSLSLEMAWKKISKTILTSQHPFETHLFIFQILFPSWPEKLDVAPAWIPDDAFIQSTNIANMMSEQHIDHIKAFHAWSTKDYSAFWQTILSRLNIRFRQKPKTLCHIENGIEKPEWLPGALFNIADSCFNAPPNKTALIYLNQSNQLTTMSYGELNQLSNSIANSLIQQGLKPGNAIAIDMPMNQYAVAIYLGIIKMGGIVVSIAESFSSEEIETRLKIADTKCIFTQDIIKRDGKSLPLYEKIIAARAPKAVVLPCNETITVALRSNDIDWKTFLVSNPHVESISCSPTQHCNILFSSGTTGMPKAVPWNHTTPIKAASDGYLHQNIQKNDIIAWPTSLGWMMGPWLVFAGLINQATIALYTDAPQTKAFGEFIQNAKVTILGVVPSLVAHWRQSHCMSGLDWNSIQLFTSTGECSNPKDMLFLMSLAGYKPIIEYCGGTEIGGAYISSTVCENNYPSVFTTPTMGLDLVLLNEHRLPSNMGEVALIPPSIGLSTEIINADHHDIYFKNMPKLGDILLRRHGDQFRRLDSGYYAALGRIDDTMNIGGIKISSAEIERTLVGIHHVIESAAIAVTPEKQGPSALVIFAAVNHQNELSKEQIKHEMQLRINQHLNPLFKIYDLVLVSALPKTASNKIMRRVLRNQYQDTINLL